MIQSRGIFTQVLIILFTRVAVEGFITSVSPGFQTARLPVRLGRLPGRGVAVIVAAGDGGKKKKATNQLFEERQKPAELLLRENREPSVTSEDKRPRAARRAAKKSQPGISGDLRFK